MSTIYAEIYQFIDADVTEYWDEINFDEVDAIDALMAEYEQAA